MKPFEEQLNAVIVDTYRSILKVEETILKRSDKIDLTINEMHLIESERKKQTENHFGNCGGSGNHLAIGYSGNQQADEKGICGKNPKRRGCPHRLCFFDPYGEEDRLGSSVLS